MKNVNYLSFTKIEDESALAVFFNSIMMRLNHIRMLCAPASFHKEESIASFQDTKFCDFCRYELWMHGVINRLNQWQELLNEYFTEYNGSWKYYAASKRLYVINEYGGDKEDYEEDGVSIRTEGLNDEEYKPYTIISDLYDEHSIDIVQDTLPDDIASLCADLVANSAMDILAELKKVFGTRVEAYREDENGEMKPMSQEQHDLDMVMNKMDAEDDSARLNGIIHAIHGMFHFIRSCKYNDDNTELLQMLRDASAGLLAIDWTAIESTIRNYSAKYVKER